MKSRMPNFVPGYAKENKPEAIRIWRIPNFYRIPDQDSQANKPNVPGFGCSTPEQAPTFSGPKDITVPPATSCFLPSMTENNPLSGRWQKQVNKWQQEAAFPLPVAGSGSPRAAPGRGKVSVALQWEPRLSTQAGEVGRGRGRGERQIKRKNTKKPQHAKQKRDSCRGNRKIPSLKEPKIKFPCEFNQGSTDILPLHSCFRLDLVRARDTVTVTLLAASAAHTFCLKKNPITFRETFP